MLLLQLPCILLAQGAMFAYPWACAQGHATAITDPKALPRSGFYQAMLSQWMGAAASADDVPALVAWWEDTCSTHQEQQLKEQQHRQKAERRPGLRTPTGHSDGGTAGPSAPGQQQHKAGAAAAAAPNALPLQPPVLVIRDAEQADMVALSTLLEALSQVRW